MEPLQIGERVVVVEHGKAWLAYVVSAGYSSSLLTFTNPKCELPFMVNSDGNAWIGHIVVNRLQPIK